MNRLWIHISSVVGHHQKGLPFRLMAWQLFLSTFSVQHFHNNDMKLCGGRNFSTGLIIEPFFYFFFLIEININAWRLDIRIWVFKWQLNKKAWKNLIMEWRTLKLNEIHMTVKYMFFHECKNPMSGSNNYNFLVINYVILIYDNEPYQISLPYIYIYTQSRVCTTYCSKFNWS